MTGSLKRKYAALSRNYRLPSFKELDAEFELTGMEVDGFLLRNIRRRIGDKLRDCLGLIETVLHPDTNVADLYESRFFVESEKKGIFDVYRKLMVTDRRTAELSLINDDALDAEFIREFFDGWKKVKPELVALAKKLRECWENDSEEGESVAYLG